MRKPPLASQDLLSNETERFRPMHHPASSGLMWLNILPFPDSFPETLYMLSNSQADRQEEDIMD